MGSQENGQQVGGVLATESGLEQGVMEGLEGSGVLPADVPLFCGPLAGLVEIAADFEL